MLNIYIIPCLTDRIVMSEIAAALPFHVARLARFDTEVI